MTPVQVKEERSDPCITQRVFRFFPRQNAANVACQTYAEQSKATLRESNIAIEDVFPMKHRDIPLIC